MGQRGVSGQRNGPPKRDRQAVEGIRREIIEEVRGGTVASVLQRGRNRDAARGDWDRTHRRHDEGVSREDTVEASDRPEERYPSRVLRRRS